MILCEDEKKVCFVGLNYCTEILLKHCIGTTSLLHRDIFPSAQRPLFQYEHGRAKRREFSSTSFVELQETTLNVLSAGMMNIVQRHFLLFYYEPSLHRDLFSSNTNFVELQKNPTLYIGQPPAAGN